MTYENTVDFGKLLNFARRIQVPFFSNQIYNSIIKDGINYNACIRVNGKQYAGMSKPISFNLIAIGFKLFLWNSVQNIVFLCLSKKEKSRLFEHKAWCKLKLIKASLIDGWVFYGFEPQIKRPIPPFLSFIVFVFFFQLISVLNIIFIISILF